jgi:hypothetical protein
MLSRGVLMFFFLSLLAYWMFFLIKLFEVFELRNFLFLSNSDSPPPLSTTELIIGLFSLWLVLYWLDNISLSKGLGLDLSNLIYALLAEYIGRTPWLADDSMFIPESFLLLDLASYNKVFLLKFPGLSV